MVVLKVLGIVLLMAFLGAYMEIGLWLTTIGTPIWWMHGLGQWLAWMFTPIAVVGVLIHDRL